MNRYGRPSKCRLIDSPPEYSGFKPRGVRSSSIDKIVLSIDEFEAIRLADYRQLSHEDSASSMNISRPVFTRLLEGARLKVSQALVDGKELVIEGGNITYRRKHRHCRMCCQDDKNEDCDKCEKEEDNNNGNT